MFVGGYLTRTVFQYTLTTAYDIATASYDNISYNAGFNIGNIVFNNNGSKMYLIGFSTCTIYQYTLSTPFDISNVTYTNVSYDSESNSCLGLKFNNDGTKMYTTSWDTDLVYEYDLTAFDLSTVSYNNNNLDVSSQDSRLSDIAFNSDGTVMLMVGYGIDAIYQYNLATGFDIATATYTGSSLSISASSQKAPWGMFIRPDDEAVYIVGSNPDAVSEFTGSELIYFPVCTLQFNNNGGTGTIINQPGEQNTNITLTSTEPTRSGYGFLSWNTNQNGLGTSYNPRDTYTLPSSGTATLYAQWSYIPSFEKFNITPGTYNAGDVFSVEVIFDSSVRITGSGTPYLKLSNGEKAFYSSFISRSTMNEELFFSYKVTKYAPTDNLSVLSLQLNGSSIQNSDGFNANISEVKGSLSGVIIGDPHITTFSGINYDLDKLGPIRLYDNGKKGEDRVIINGYSASGNDDWGPNRQYFRKFYFAHGEKELVINSGYRGRYVEILKNTGFITNEKILKFSENAVSYCQECNKKADHDTSVMIHRLETAMEEKMHYIQPLKRNSIEFMLGDREFFVSVTNVDENNLQPCRLSMIPLKKIEGTGCLVDEKYGNSCGLESLDDKRIMEEELVRAKE